MNKCENCCHLDPANDTIGYCLHPYLEAIPKLIHRDGFIYDITMDHECEVFEEKNYE